MDSSVNGSRSLREDLFRAGALGALALLWLFSMSEAMAQPSQDPAVQMPVGLFSQEQVGWWVTSLLACWFAGYWIGTQIRYVRKISEVV